MFFGLFQFKDMISPRWIGYSTLRLMALVVAEAFSALDVPTAHTHYLVVSHVAFASFQSHSEGVAE
jgi:hypothetical protein